MFSSDNTTFEMASDMAEYWEWIDKSNVSDYKITNNSSLSEQYDYYFNYAVYLNQFLVKFSRFLWQRLSLFWFTVSVFGNFLTILVLTQKTSKQFSTSILLVSLALSDMFASIYFLDGFLVSNELIQKTYNDIDCKLRLFLPKVGATSSILSLTIISIERAVSVKMPHKVKLVFTVKVARLLVALVWVFSIALASLQSYLYVYSTLYDSPKCLVSSVKSKFRLAYQVDIFVGLVLNNGSWVVNVSCTFLILNALLKNVIDKNVSNKTKIKSVTKILLIVNIVYVLCVTPSVSYDVYIMVLTTFVDTKWWNMSTYFNSLYIFNILVFLRITNNVLNFFIYFLSGSRFRKETKDLFLSCKFGK